MKLYFIRHGRTEWNEEGRFQGSNGDSRLAKIGNALEDRGGGKVATGVENASVLIDALHVDAQLLL